MSNLDFSRPDGPLSADAIRARFAALLIAGRKAKEWTQPRLAAETGIAVIQIARYETCAAECGIVYAARLAHALGFPLDAIGRD